MHKQILLLTFISVFILLSIPIITYAQVSIFEDEFILQNDDCDCLRDGVLCYLLEAIYNSLMEYCIKFLLKFGFDPPLSLLLLTIIWLIGTNIRCSFCSIL
jgi:hypothetical protein